MTKEADVILIYIEDKPVSFALIEKIIPDSKPEWFQVKLILLQIPLTVTTWILRKSYINGAKFLMENQSMYLEKVVCPNNYAKNTSTKAKHNNVISLFGD